MSPRAARTLAQAKINLALRVLDKEIDGYHAIETVFLRLELGDDVEIRTTTGKRSLKCYEMRDWPAEGNLAFRAAALYADETGWPKGFEIEIEKNIPIGGGLGGGSADAAAVLRILNGLAPNPISDEALLALGGDLGSDVPFLASDYAMAMAWGRGDKLLRLDPLPVRDVQLFFPPFGIDTAQAYGLLDESRTDATRRNPELTTEMFATWDSAAKNSVNDFEQVIRPRWPEIDALLARGARSGVFHRMSGSGSTVFKVAGVNAPRVESKSSAGSTIVGAGTRSIITRTSTSVVQIELLD
ncbi:MAG TPA: 4-(cytidine 5'-diphospho)-2-C-methyl-D-erythritol kinase [Gemmatimonadaceae bacterium]|nr:4-(cytidine 5'-diphospho)-2-C-methyl-D-erythritol kinase [Gemmatimonadaceae bacterium]